MAGTLRRSARNIRNTSRVSSLAYRIIRYTELLLLSTEDFQELSLAALKFENLIK